MAITKPIFSPIFKANLKWVTLVSEKFFYDRSVMHGGIWHTLSVEDLDGHVYWSQTAPNKVSHEFDIVFTTSILRTWRYYLTLVYYFPKVGYFTVKLRLDEPKLTRRNTRVTATVSTTSASYQKALLKGSSALKKWQKSLPGASVASSVRPSPETRNKSYPRYFYSKANGYDPWSYINTTGTYVAYSRTWTGTRTPGYWNMARRQLPENGHTVSITETDVDPLIECDVNANGVDYSNRVDVHTLHYPPPTFATKFTSTQYQIANLNAISRLRNAMQTDTANLAQDLCEFGQTIRMIGTTVRRVTGAHNNLKNGNIPGAIRALWGSNQNGRFRDGGMPHAARSLAQNWLELQYGWKPLLADVHDGIEKTRNLLLKSPDPLIVSMARGSARNSDFTSSVINLFSYSLPYIPAGQRNWSKQATVKYKVRYKMDDAHRAFLAQTGFTNPVNLAWELLPYSFVVDWFYTVGPWLESFSAYEGLVFVDGMKLEFEKQWVTDSVAYRGHPVPNNAYYLDVTSRGSWKQVDLRRTRITTFPMLDKPVLKSPWSTVHALNGLALLFSSFGFSRNLRV